MLWNPTSWSHLELTVQIELALNPCNSFLINDPDMTCNNVENYGFVVLNVKLQVKHRLKAFYWHLKLWYTAFPLNSNTNSLFCWNFLHILAISVIHKPELNLLNHLLLFMCLMEWIWEVPKIYGQLSLWFWTKSGIAGNNLNQSKKHFQFLSFLSYENNESI